MTRMNWRMLIGPAMASAGVIAWVVFPATFAHGVIVGFFVGPGIIMGGMALFARRRLKRMRERKLKPPPLSVGSWDYETYPPTPASAWDVASIPAPNSPWQRE